MTQEDKDLLLKDLCARLPYGVILNCCDIVEEKLTCIDEHGLINHDYDIDEIKPYLFPISKVVEEIVTTSNKHIAVNVDFFHKNHIDYRGLIEKGLAIDAIGLNIY